MDIVFVLLPISIVLAVIALGGFLWSARSGQFEDMETPARRMLSDEVGVQTQQANSKQSLEK